MDWHLGERSWYVDYPQDIPHNIDVPEIDLAFLLKMTAQRIPDNPAIVFLDSVMSYRELDDLVDRVATGLHELGLRKGDVLAMMLPNSQQFVIGYYACQRLGVTVTAINPIYKPLEVRHQLKDSGAKALIVLDAVYDSLTEILPQTSVKHLIGTNIVDMCSMSGLKVWLGKKLGKIPSGNLPAIAIPFTSLTKSKPHLPKVAIDPINDVAVLQYSSGTTGLPKGAMLTSYNLVANAIQCRAWLGGKGEGMGFVGVLPLFHIYAMTCVMNMAITVGAFQLLLPKPPDDIAELFALIQKWGRGTELYMPGVAALFNKINNSPKLADYDLSSLTRCLSAAGPLPQDVQATFEAKTTAKVVEGYGMTETSPTVTGNTFQGRRKMGSVGIPLPSTDAKIMDLETGEIELGRGEEQIGMICVRGPQVMKGYYNNPEETAECLKDGWLSTGDIGYMDEDGWIYIRDRAKDLIKHKSYSVFPAEVEDYMFAHPDILEVAVIGLSNPKVGEIIKAFVVIKPTSTDKVTEDDIKAWCTENLTAYKAPSEIEFIDELPKNMVGKVLRRVLKEEELKKRG